MAQSTQRLVCGFGEVMVRLSPVGPQTFGDSNVIQITAGGSEANVLAKLGHFSPHVRTELITALNDDLGARALVADLNKYRVGLNHVRWVKGQRNGVYYLEQGLGPIVARVDYDRQDAAIARLEPDAGLFDVVKGASALFVSGITPALSDRCCRNTEFCLGRARESRVPVFFDVNYRKKLWAPDKARATLDGFLKQGWISVLITTETDAKTVFGIDCGVDDESPIETLIDKSRQVLEAFKSRYADCCELYVLTIRKRITNEMGVWTSAALLPDNSYIVGDIFDYTILDRPGAGDACSGGLVAGYLGISRDGTFKDGIALKDRVKMGLDLGNRAAIVAQKTIGDMGPCWDAPMYFNRVSASKEIAR